MIVWLAAMGIGLRYWHFRGDYSLNHDDICLALNLIGRNSRELTHTLSFDQAAPLGFLLIEHAMVRLMGPGERALRLLPFLFGCVSVGLLARLASKLQPALEALAVVAFFAFSQALIESCIQVKPYSLDVLVSIIIVTACLPLIRSKATANELVTAAAVGAIALWCSFPAVFLLIGIGGVSAAAAIADRKLARRSLLGVFSAWAIDGVLAFWFSLRPGILNRNLARLDSALLFPIHTPARIIPWLVEAATNLGLVATTTRLALPAAAALLAAALIALRRRDRIGLMLAAPIVLCFIAAVAQEYPWFPRLIFFTAPLTLILIARQIGYAMRTRGRAAQIMTAAILTVAIVYSGLSAFKYIVVRGSGFDDPRGAVAAIARDWQPGDLIYASGAAMPCIMYYRQLLPDARRLNFVSSRHPDYVPNQIERIVPLPKTNGRLWFMYFQPTETDFDTHILNRFHQAGTLIFSSRYQNFEVTLWELGSGLPPGF